MGMLMRMRVNGIFKWGEMFDPGGSCGEGKKKEEILIVLISEQFILFELAKLLPFMMNSFRVLVSEPFICW